MGGKQLKLVKECKSFVKSLIERFDKKIKYKRIESIINQFSWHLSAYLLDNIMDMVGLDLVHEVIDDYDIT